MRGYFIRVGDKEIGPFTSEAAAKAEAKELRKQDYDVKVVSKSVAESTWLDHLGHAEKDVDIEGDDDDDLNWLNDDDSDDDDSDDDDDDKDDDDDDDKDDDIDWETLFKDDDKGDDDKDDKDKDEDKPPGGEHFYFKDRSKAKA
jgi:hypothetical protein